MSEDQFKERLFGGFKYESQEDAFRKNEGIIKLLKYFEIGNIFIILGCIISLILDIFMMAQADKCGPVTTLGVPLIFCLLLIIAFSISNSIYTRSDYIKINHVFISVFITGFLLNLAFSIFFLIRKDLNFGNCYISSTQGGLLVAANFLTLFYMLFMLSAANRLRKSVQIRGISSYLTFLSVLKS